MYMYIYIRKVPLTMMLPSIQSTRWLILAKVSYERKNNIKCIPPLMTRN